MAGLSPLQGPGQGQESGKRSKRLVLLSRTYSSLVPPVLPIFFLRFTVPLHDAAKMAGFSLAKDKDNKPKDEEKGPSAFLRVAPRSS
jgi:hypothetical protein